MDCPAPSPTHPLAVRFCEHVACQVHPTVLRELLYTARLTLATDPSWPAFSDRLVALSRSHHPRLDTPDEQIDSVIADRSVRDRTRAFLRSAAGADPVDAVQDAELILWLMRERLEQVLASPPEPPPT